MKGNCEVLTIFITDGRGKGVGLCLARAVSYLILTSVERPFKKRSKNVDNAPDKENTLAIASGFSKEPSIVKERRCSVWLSVKGTVMTDAISTPLGELAIDSVVEDAEIE